MISELLYPERQRCRICRRYFDFVVILRQYCSRSCAGLPEQPETDETPRKCRVRIGGVWYPKAVFFAPDEADRAVKRNGKSHYYLCEPPDGCGMYHLASNPNPFSEPSGTGEIP